MTALDTAQQMDEAQAPEDETMAAQALSDLAFAAARAPGDAKLQERYRAASAHYWRGEPYQCMYYCED